MDRASFWSALTRPSVFSYTAKALILISLFPSGLNLWSGTEDCLVCVGVHVCVCACVCEHTVSYSPRAKFTGTHVCINCQDTHKMFHFSCSAISVPGMVAVFPVCPTQVCQHAALPVLQIQRTDLHPYKARPKGSSFRVFSVGQ